MNRLTIKIDYDEVRAINSWVVYDHPEYVVLVEKLIQAHKDIHDIFIAPTACFLIFPITYKPEFGKVYKDMFLIHPTELSDAQPLIICCNDRLLDTCFPDESDRQKNRIKSKNLNKVRYLNVLEDREMIFNSFENQNYHLIGVYCPELEELHDAIRENT